MALAQGGWGEEPGPWGIVRMGFDIRSSITGIGSIRSPCPTRAVPDRGVIEND